MTKRHNKLWTVDCGLWTIKNDRGLILLAALLMLVTLIGITLICSFPLAKEADDEIRYKITLQRIKEIKRAFFGRIAEKEGGEDINAFNTSCGGFFSDFGMPSDGIKGHPDPFGAGNFINVLIKKKEVTDPEGLGWEKWHYDPDKKFWAGYRGPYLVPPPGEDDFVDGWGNPFKVILSGCGHWMHIKSFGEDGKTGGVGYADDIVEKIINIAHDEKIMVEVANESGRVLALNVGIIYPLFGRVEERYSKEPKVIENGETAEFKIQLFLDGLTGDATAPACGISKILIRNEITGRIQTKTVCFPNAGSGPIPQERRIEIEYEG